MKKSSNPRRQDKKSSKPVKKTSKSNSEATRSPSVYLAVTLVISIAIMLFTFIIPYRQSLFPVSRPTPQTNAQIESMKRDLDNIKQQVDGLFLGIKSSPNTAVLNARLNLIDKRLMAIENSIADDPTRAVELTLLHRDVTQLGKDLEATRDEMRRNFDLFQFFLGSIALTFFVFVVNYLFAEFKNRSSSKRN